MKKSIMSLAGISFAAGAVVSNTEAQTERPNIIILLADDLGYADLGVTGVTDAKTPNIDALFAGGIQFKEAYVQYPACGPSRASIMTGRHHLRFGFAGNPDHVVPTAPGNLLGLPLEEITLADAMKARGYATGMTGKWHLGHQRPNHPMNRGFDEFYGFLGSLYRYFDLGNMQVPNSMMRGFDRIHEKEYQTDAIAREAVAFINRHKKEPFFLYVPFGAVHTPLMFDQNPGNASIPLNGTGDKVVDRKMLVNMIEGLDRAVGTIMEKLKTGGLDKNTLVFFLSDNGGPEATGVYNNGILRGYKGTLFEGGIRVPMAVYWPGKIPAGQVYSHPVLATDMFATSVELAGGALAADREYDSKNLMPVLSGKMSEPLHAGESFFWNALGMQAVRKGDWKLVMRNLNVIGLYNISADPAEQNNQAAANPERVQELRSEFDTWQAALPPAKYVWVGPEKFAEWTKENGPLWK